MVGIIRDFNKVIVDTLTQDGSYVHVFGCAHVHVFACAHVHTLTDSDVLVTWIRMAAEVGGVLD